MFLKSEFSEENLNFWIKAEEYKKNISMKKAKEIFRNFVKKDSVFEVIFFLMCIPMYV